MSFMPRIAAILGAPMRSGRRAETAVTAIDIVLDDRLELFADAFALERHTALAVDENRCHRLLPGTGQADSDVGLPALPRAVDHAAHDGHRQVLDPRIATLPHRHALAKIRLHARGQLLKDGAGGTTASRTGGDHRNKGPPAPRLQAFLGNLNLSRARATPLRPHRHA